MENEINPSSAQIVATIRYVPKTLFFTAPNRAWLQGDLFLGGVRVGESHHEFFTSEEFLKLNEIVANATIRHHEQLRKYGNN